MHAVRSECVLHPTQRPSQRDLPGCSRRGQRAQAQPASSPSAQRRSCRREPLPRRRPPPPARTSGSERRGSGPAGATRSRRRPAPYSGGPPRFCGAASPPAACKRPAERVACNRALVHQLRHKAPRSPEGQRPLLLHRREPGRQAAPRCNQISRPAAFKAGCGVDRAHREHCWARDHRLQTLEGHADAGTNVCGIRSLRRAETLRSAFTHTLRSTREQARRVILASTG